MLEIKTWLETAGEPVANTCFPPGDVPPLPYIVFTDTEDHGGGDMRNLVTSHDLRIERYSETDDDNAALDALLNAKAIKFKKEKQWIVEDSRFMTVYFNMTLIEREVVNNG